MFQIYFKTLNRYELIYLSFAFDSLLKIDIFNVRMHLGILLIFYILTCGVVSSGMVIGLKGFLRHNWTLLPFAIYQILALALNHTYPGTFKVALYFFLSIVIFYFIYSKVEYISKEAVSYFQWILILTGLLQFGLFKIFGYQLTFFDPEHYMIDASFVFRMRGFFVEPNWYSIIMSFNTLLFLSLYTKEFIRKRYLVLFTLLCFYFNGSYTSIAIVVILLAFETVIHIRSISRTRIIAFVLSFIVMLTLLIGRANLNVQNQGGQFSDKYSNAINYGSRLFPVIKTIEFMESQSVIKKLFGFGVGSWPYFGIKNNLGYMGIFGDYEVLPGKRDSAEFQVFMLELGYLSIFLLFFDHIYNYFKHNRNNILFSIACAYLAACYFIYPIYNFMIYLIPYYIFRSIIKKGLVDEKAGYRFQT